MPTNRVRELLPGILSLYSFADADHARQVADRRSMQRGSVTRRLGMNLSCSTTTQKFVTLFTTEVGGMALAEITHGVLFLGQVLRLMLPQVGMPCTSTSEDRTTCQEPDHDLKFGASSRWGHHLFHSRTFSERGAS